METVCKPKRVQIIKSRLMGYRERERDIDNQIERIENLEEKLFSLRSPVISGMPASHNAAKDKIANMIAQKDELEREVRMLVSMQDKERAWIEGMLSYLQKANERACIRMRYIDAENWSKVAEMLFGNMDDFNDRMDSYIRRTTKTHNRAIEKMADYLTDEEQ